MIPSFGYGGERAELETELAAALAELPELRAAHQAAKTAAEDGRWRYELFVQRMNAATRHGIDDASPALLQLLNNERHTRDTANAAAEKARRAVANMEWKIGCLRADIDQLAALDKPPLLVAPRPQVIPRPKPDLGEYDPIIMPPGRTPADAA